MEPTSAALLHIEDGIATITLNRPERMNAFNGAQHSAFAAAIHQVETDPSVRVVVITGAGRGFCAGQDLSDPVVNDSPERRADLGDAVDLFNPTIAQLRALPKPVIAQVQGVAAGAGASLALACDFVIAGESARFLQAFVKIGLVPDSGSTHFLPRLVGSARAMGLAMLGDAISAKDAAAWGMIWQCVPDADLANTVAALATRLADGPSLAYQHIKALMNQSLNTSLDAQLAAERVAQSTLGASEDYRESVQAFKEKRAPKYQGK